MQSTAHAAWGFNINDQIQVYKAATGHCFTEHNPSNMGK